MVEEVTYYIHTNYSQGCYDSCEEVQSPSTSGAAMELMCGSWGAELCTPERWFDYMGSMDNGYSPFEILQWRLMVIIPIILV
jgi:hypothetical protein